MLYKNMWSDSDDEAVAIIFTICELFEQNEIVKREWWVHPHNQKRDAEHTIKQLIAELRNDPVKFRSFTGMQIETYDFLLGLIENAIVKQDTNYRKSITPGERLLITLRYLVTGKTFKSLSYQFRCGASTIKEIVMETCNAIWEILSPIYLPTPDVKKWTSIADAFCEMWNFPNCVGAIGGKHIRIQCPPNPGLDYHGNKKCYSIHLQSVVDANGQFICVDVGDLEKDCDDEAFKLSNFGKKIISNELNLPQKQKMCKESNEYFPFVFVAEKGYPLLINVMRPFARNHLTDERRIFNYRLSRARRVVDCAFSMLTKRFRIFDNTILLSPNKVQTITLAACALHNMIRDTENSFHEIYIERDAMDDVIQEDTNLQIARPSNGARYARNQYVSYFTSPMGSISWQMKYAK